jgi:hypothetical protein
MRSVGRLGLGGKIILKMVPQIYDIKMLPVL